MQAKEQGREGNFAAWLVVGLVHAGLLWLLTTHTAREFNAQPESRMRLLMLQATPRAPATPPPRTAQPKLQIIPPRAVTQTVVAEISTPATSTPASTPVEASALLQQGHDWARQQSPTPTFTKDPLRSRHAQLPGGERANSFRMREPRSPASVINSVARVFGDPGPPCPRVKARLYGLLTSTSDNDRKLLEEELRRDEQFCRN